MSDLFKATIEHLLHHFAVYFGAATGTIVVATAVAFLRWFRRRAAQRRQLTKPSKWTFRRQDDRSRQDDRPFVLVYEDRNIGGEAVNTVKRTFVASEDVEAMWYLRDALVREGIPAERIVRREASQFDKYPNLNDYRSNVLLICKRNKETIRYLQLVRDVRKVDFGFELIDKEWCIKAGGRTFTSPSFQQEATLLSIGENPVDGPLVDYAIVGRVANPHNYATKVFFVAGIRAIGTAGAGQFFGEQSDLIWQMTQGSDFVAVLKISYMDRQVDRISVVHSELLTEGPR